MAQYEAQLIVVNKPGYFSREQVRAACRFVIDNQPPAWLQQCDHKANVAHAHTVMWSHTPALD